MSMQEMRTRIATCSLDRDGVLRVSFDPGVEETLADAQEAVRLGTILRQGRRCPVFIDLRNVKSQDRDARQYYSSPEVAASSSAVALLIGTRVSQLIANFFLSVSKPHVPTKLFTDEAEALTWLRGFAV